jgi:hypothetical protein
MKIISYLLLIPTQIFLKFFSTAGVNIAFLYFAGKPNDTIAMSYCGFYKYVHSYHTIT